MLRQLLRRARRALYPMLHVVRIEKDGSLYLWRLHLTPFTRRGSLMLHVFWRGDADRDPHDHPWDFWTFPLRSYVELAVCDDGVERPRVVPALRWSFRPATHQHRVRRPLQSGDRAAIEDGTYALRDCPYWHGLPLVTLVRTSDKKQSWGFWPVVQSAWNKRHVERQFVPWHQYLGG